MLKTDLHMHTNVSDGTWDVYELKEKLKENDIKIFSITDHDDIGNIENMSNILTPEDNLIFIKGVEVTATYNNKEYHMTLYNYDINNKELLEFLKWTRDLRLDYNDKFIHYMSTLHESITFKDFLEYKEDRARGGWKSSNYLIDKKIHKDMAEHFEDIKKSGLTITFKSPEEVINICKRSGGYIFLAHPSYHYKKTVMPIEELKMWLELGIDGVECYTPYNDKKQSEYYKEFCDKNNLMISGGSDCHGDFIKERKLGIPTIDLSELKIDKLLNKNLTNYSFTNQNIVL